MKNPNLDLMSIEELTKLAKMSSGMERELLLRQIAKRENTLFHRSSITRPTIPFDYGF